MGTVLNHPSELMQLEPGEHLGYSDWLAIEQERVNLFADATGDHQWIHVDPEKSRSGPFGTTIAHGYLTVSLASKFLMEVLVVENVEFGINYGTDRVRFPSAVPVGSRIRGGCEFLRAEERDGGVQFVVRVTIEVEGSDRPACVVDTISLFYPAS